MRQVSEHTIVSVDGRLKRDGQKEKFACIVKNKYRFLHYIGTRAEREVLRPLGKDLTSVELSDVHGRLYVPPLPHAAKYQEGWGAGAHVGWGLTPLLCVCHFLAEELR